MEQRLRFLGIPQVRLNVIERDQAQFTNVYLGMAVLYGDNKEVIPAITDTNNCDMIFHEQDSSGNKNRG